MNRRAFFATPLALLPGEATASGADVGGVTINLSGAFVADQKFVDEQLLPAIRAAIEDRDVVIIPMGSRQGRELR